MVGENDDPPKSDSIIESNHAAIHKLLVEAEKLRELLELQSLKIKALATNTDPKQPDTPESVKPDPKTPPPAKE